MTSQKSSSQRGGGEAPIKQTYVKHSNPKPPYESANQNIVPEATSPTTTNGVKRAIDELETTTSYAKKPKTEDQELLEYNGPSMDDEYASMRKISSIVL